MKMTWQEFEDKYKFEENEDGNLFFEFEDKRVKEIQDKHKDEAYKYIWTRCYEGETEYIVHGYAFVNRNDYMIATIPWDLEDNDYLEIIDD